MDVTDIVYFVRIFHIALGWGGGGYICLLFVHFCSLWLGFFSVYVECFL